MKILSGIFCVAIVMFLFTTACKKKPTDPVKPQPTVGSLLIGTWAAEYDVYDTNFNGIADESERFYYDSFFSDPLSLVYNADGTGAVYEGDPLDSPDISNFNWHLENEGLNLVMTGDDIDSGFFRIVAIDDKQLFFQTDMEDSSRSWIMLKRK